MSGPKCYEPPPPRYSAKVFNGRLQDIFVGQSQLRSLRDELSRCEMADPARGIRFDCKKFLNEIEPRLAPLLAPIALDCPSSFDQEVRNRIERSLDATLRGLQECGVRLDGERESFHGQRDDYDAYVSYENYREKTLAAFATLQEQVCAYLAKYLAGDYAAIASEAAGRVQRIALHPPLPLFDFGFSARAGEERARVAQAVEEAKREVDRVRADAADQYLAATGSSLKGKRGRRQSKEVQVLADQVGEAVGCLTTPGASQKFEAKLAEYLESEVFQDAYFYRELLADVRAAQVTEGLKAQIQKALAEASTTAVHPEAAALWGEMRSLAARLLAEARVKRQQVEDIHSRVARCKEVNAALVERDDIERKEREFLRRQLVEGLERLGYEVLIDAEVIDFEAQGDFALKVPGQENFLSLRFREDGSFVYNFLIPEAREELGPEATRRRLREMEETCQGFRGVVSGLGSIGVPLKLTRERPVDEAALLQAPEALRTAASDSRKSRRRKATEQPRVLSRKGV